MKIMNVKLSNLTCQACKKLTEKAIFRIPDVVKVEVNLDSKIATIGAERNIEISEIIEVLKGTPYKVENI